MSPAGQRVVATPSFEDVVRARVELAAVVGGPTPVAQAFEPWAGGAGGGGSARGAGRVVLKLETLQPTGSFKVRGAAVAMAAVVAAGGSAPVVAASAGNHALGVAWAAARLGVLDRVTVVVPANASAAKVEGLRRLGVRVVAHGATYDEAEAHGLAVAEESGGRFLSGYNDPDVIAGGGTIGLELAEQVPGLARVVVPVGGGGLISGIALALSEAAPGVEVVGAEAAASPGLSSAVAAGRVVTVDVGDTLADGLAGNLEPGSVTVGLAGRHVSRFVAVAESAVVEAMRTAVRRLGLVVEGSAAVALAAAGIGGAGGALEPVGGATAVVLSGRNVADAILARVMMAADEAESGEVP